MPDFRFSFLSEKELPELHETFLQSFADYLVPIQLNAEQFKTKVKREGVEPSFCVAAYVDTKMAGFILTGLGEWHGTPTAYNAGTGVLPQYRGHKLTQQLYAFMLPKLRESGIEQCQLEVIRENASALRAYKAVGFKVTRSLELFRTLKKEMLLKVEVPDAITIAAISKPDWKTYSCFWDAEPSWQNTGEAIMKSPDEKVVLEARDKEQEVVGYIIFFPNTGSVAQFAVDKSRRGKGIGTALLQEAVRLTTAPALMFVNIDTSATSLLSYLERRHFTHMLRQYEMLLPIV
ncbi:GNAT family N-acetyltransferase [Pontibacter diazotrophicus]|uniref:GNAT family N-acetyltransferase n=1 Tax=Pontibacter diazotrophicus TaxID=1400979 RepID=A0A3D8LCH9_9BACT|nr:GNAT family N-acetyltransferase [Pontibacter diazotrophicus]RDV15100.1 GNAT family N-acetyltransferase [Pontibacter diazotrophicus]